MASTPEIAQALALACLNHATFVGDLIPTQTTKGDTATMGKKVGEFYEAIYKVVVETFKTSA